MRKVKLHLKDVYDALGKSQRKYQNLILSGISIDEASSRKLEKILKNVKNLAVYDITFSNNETFFKFFKNLETVKNVSINSCGSSIEQNFRIIHLEKCEAAAEFYLKFDSLQLQCDNIVQKVVIDNNHEGNVEKIFNPLEFLIKRQENLKCLIIDSPTCDSNMNSEALNAIFKILYENYDSLKTIQSMAITMRTSRCQTNFIDLLKCYGDSLQALKLTADTEALDLLSQNLLKTIQNDMKLTGLRISVDDVFCDVEEWVEIRRQPPQISCNLLSVGEPNKNLKVLVLDKVALTCTEKFFRGFPGIQHLTLDMCSKSPRQTNFFLDAVKWLGSLEHLHVPFIPDIPDENMKLELPSLKSIFFKYYPEGFAFGKGVIGKRNCESCQKRLQNFLIYCSKVYYQSFVIQKSLSMFFSRS